MKLLFICIGLLFISIIGNIICRIKGSMDLKKLKNELNENNIKSPEDCIAIEKYACSKMFAPLKDIGICLRDICVIPSSLGSCAFKNGFLYTSLELEVQGEDRDIIKYLWNLFNGEKRKEYVEIAKSILTPKTMYETVDEDTETEEIFTDGQIEDFKQHIFTMLRWSKASSKLKKYRRISERNIAFYRIIGGEQYLSDIHGGGANMKGAAIGGVIAGGAGAVVGSKAGTEIQTSVIKKDTRRLFLYFYRPNGVVSEEVKTDYMDEIVEQLRNWMPHKDYDYVVAMGNQNITNKNAEKKNIQGQQSQLYVELKEMKELLDLGILTKEEFDERKRKILQ